jgi:hypothetical protein
MYRGTHSRRRRLLPSGGGWSRRRSYALAAVVLVVAGGTFAGRTLAGAGGRPGRQGSELHRRPAGPDPHGLGRQAVAAPTTAATTTTTPTTTTTLPAPQEPGGGYSLFPGKRVVAFYGAPDGGAMGVLGRASPPDMWADLAAQAAYYHQAGFSVLPSYELVSFVAQPYPEPDGSYSYRLPDDEIRRYLSVVQAHRGLLILDIQPGHGSVLADAKTLAPYLELPDVALALDPEWEMPPGAKPGSVVGHTTGEEIDQVAGWLSALAVAHRLPPKLLLIHQFTVDMVQDKAAVSAPADIDLVFNMDGFGTWADKVKKYQMLASDPRFPLGMKLFYRQDTPLQPPATVLTLQPAPSVIEYE